MNRHNTVRGFFCGGGGRRSSFPQTISPATTTNLGQGVISVYYQLVTGEIGDNNTSILGEDKVISGKEQKRYLNRTTELFEDILIMCDGKSYADIKTAIEKVSDMILKKSKLEFTLSDIR